MKESRIGDVAEVPQYNSFEISVGVGRLSTEKDEIAHEIGSWDAEGEHSPVADAQRYAVVVAEAQVATGIQRRLEEFVEVKAIVLTLHAAHPRESLESAAQLADRC
jgi:hypothetical protein